MKIEAVTERMNEIVHAILKLKWLILNIFNLKNLI